MKLPNGEGAVLDVEKLTEYCLNPDHPRGKHKARVFRAACGFTAENAELMREQLLEAAADEDAIQVPPDVHGQRYVIECLLSGPTGRARVRAAWIVRPGEDFPRFVSAYVL
ncbi:MAG: hypothetical protein L0228_18415 [Planctomycetes bacterium]|nr:hypothetical protein [Planctomycetota bacterium]